MNHAAEPTWIVGSGGMLGRALHRAAPGAYCPRGVPWRDEAAAIAVLRGQAQDFARRVGSSRWRVMWAAGAAVVATDGAAVARELAVFRGLVDALAELPPGGTFFMASSAGGVYAGSSPAPFSEHSATAPLAAYGELKLAQESAATAVLAGRARVVVGRYSNLYGPDQNLLKAQGLISQLCLAAVTRRSTNLYVPLETMRDYLYTDDAAALTLAAVAEEEQRADNGAVVRVLCSEEPATVARIVELIHRQTRARPLLSLGVHAAAARQVRDLRMRSVHRSQRRLVTTTLTVGVSRVLQRMGEQVRSARLP